MTRKNPELLEELEHDPSAYKNVVNAMKSKARFMEIALETGQFELLDSNVKDELLVEYMKHNHQLISECAKLKLELLATRRKLRSEDHG